MRTAHRLLPAALLLLAATASPARGIWSVSVTVGEPRCRRTVVAFDPRTGQPVVAWLAEGGRYDLTIARLASRSGCQGSGCG